MDHHSGSENYFRVLVQGTAGEKPKHMLLPPDDDRVSRIRSAAGPCYYIKLLRQKIDQLPLSFIAPLRADDGGYGAKACWNMHCKITLSPLIFRRKVSKIFCTFPHKLCLVKKIQRSPTYQNIKFPHYWNILTLVSGYSISKDAAAVMVSMSC